MTTKKTKKRTRPTVDKVPEVPEHTFPMQGMSPAMERPADSEAVGLTKQLEELNREIERCRRNRASLLSEAENLKDRISCSLLQHASVSGKLYNATATPIQLA